MSFDVFLCHNSQDKPKVKEIAEKLKQQGLTPWLDVWELRPGLEQFSNKEYKIDEETRQQLCDRRVALGLEEETVALLYNRLGKKLYSQSQLEEAISVFLEALSIMESAETYLNLGLAYDKQGLQEAAIFNLKQAQALFEEQEQDKEAQEIADLLNRFI
jgi:tetratricopeptide (TPR) repeat protein